MYVTQTGEDFCEWRRPFCFIPAATQLLGSILHQKEPSAVTSIAWMEPKRIEMTIINPPFYSVQESRRKKSFRMHTYFVGVEDKQA